MASNEFKVSLDSATLMRDIKKLGYNAQNLISNYLKEEALRWQKDLRKTITKNRSVVSGDLRRSMTIQPKSKFEYIVGSNLFYAPYVEFGTRKSVAKPYFQPTYDKHAEPFKTELKAILEEAIRRI